MRAYVIFMLIMLACPVWAQKDFTDTLSTDQGDLVIHVLGHASVWFEYKGMSVYVDPYSKVEDFAGMAKADLLLITHADKDHFDTLAIREVLKTETRVIYTQSCAELCSYAGMDTIMANGDSVSVLDLQIHAVPAYNIEKTKHPKGVGNGYVIQFGNRRVYLSGDTEKIPEMENLPYINLAFLPLSQPYGMTPEMMAETVILINPDILVPYHYDDENVAPLLDLLKDIPDLEVWTGDSVTPSACKTILQDSDLMIWPNPVEDMLFFEVNDYYSSAAIYDMTGLLLVLCQPVNKGMLDIGFLKEGQYILQIIAQDRIHTGIFHTR